MPAFSPRESRPGSPLAWREGALKPEQGEASGWLGDYPRERRTICRLASPRSIAYAMCSELTDLSSRRTISRMASRATASTSAALKPSICLEAPVTSKSWRTDLSFSFKNLGACQLVGGVQFDYLVESPPDR